MRELVLPLYANGGRHSIDAVLFFKLQLVLFFENLRSGRQLMGVVADRLSLRWCLGYDLDERFPDHSSLTKIRERYTARVPPGPAAAILGRTAADLSSARGYATHGGCSCHAVGQRQPRAATAARGAPDARPPLPSLCP